MSVEGIQQDAKSNGNGQVDTVVGLGQVQQGKQFGITLCVEPKSAGSKGIVRLRTSSSSSNLLL
jgi:hypothetical protein